MEKIGDGESWNKKRIFTVFFLITVLAVGAYFFKTRFLDQNLSPKEVKSVKGISLEEENRDSDENADIDVQKTVKEKINSLQQEIFGLNIAEIASSSPQVQKIIKDMQALQQYPANQIKEACREVYKKVCGL